VAREFIHRCLQRHGVSRLKDVLPVAEPNLPERGASGLPDPDHQPAHHEPQAKFQRSYNGKEFTDRLSGAKASFAPEGAREKMVR